MNREIEVCKPLHHRRRRSPHGFLDHHHGHPYHECETEKKEVPVKESRFDLKLVTQVCKVVPTVEEKSDEVNVCHIEPEKVSNQNL